MASMSLAASGDRGTRGHARLKSAEAGGSGGAAGRQRGDRPIALLGRAPTRHLRAISSRGGQVRIFATMLALLTALSAHVVPLGTQTRAWDVTYILQNKRHVLNVSEKTPLLAAAEAAGLLPGSDCRRGRCLSCAARVVDGAPFSVRVAEDTALCSLAHDSGLVLLCSAYVTGPGVCVELDYEGEAMEMQYSTRWRSDVPEHSRPNPPTHFSLPEDAVVLFERTIDLDVAALPDADDDGGA